ncbi:MULTISPECIES: phosphoribosyltransferase family protein [Providencia]|uniref:Phosphoribosyltransferase n=2 Tax=Providencia TaxID=586 RepID=A0ABD5L8H9_PROST|nr:MULTISPECIES: phosphoribosyltransferase family protein [Providencia]ELR5046059.1 hypothetical protein [Providencia rettgeri]ELR5290323.1 hypothetical protein [Providencia stuartii]MCR4178713.1 phosphoribosyltransferase family protein [Providencia vermicola]URE79952.1 hypothetical protein MWH14_06505 [Providencia stuartii]
MSQLFSVSAENISLLGSLISPVTNARFYKAYRYLPKLFYYENGVINSRGEVYYQKLNCNQIIYQLMELKNQYLMVPDIESEKVIKYVIADHMFSKLLRMLDFIIGNNDEDRDVINGYIKAIDWCATVIINFIMGTDLPKYLGEMESLSINSNLGLKYPREQIEGDNHFISLTSALWLTEQYDYIVGIALGGVGCSALISCYLKKPLGIIKLSHYDEVNINKKIPFYRSWEGAGKILLVDDNCGSGRTLSHAKKYLKQVTMNDISTFATELHWEKFFRKKVYQHPENIFNPKTLTELSPWCFRHFELINLLRKKEKYHTEAARITTADWMDYSLTIISLLEKILPEEKYLLNLKSKFELFMNNNQ